MSQQNKMDFSDLKKRPIAAKESAASRIIKNHPIVKCLEEAIDETIKEDADHTNNKCDQSRTEQNYIPLTKTMSTRIVNKLCTSMYETNWEDETTTQAPAALLKGKVVSYNRMDNRWRIVISNGKITKRKNFIRNENSFGKKKRDCLWDDGNDNDDSIEIDGLVQLLVYDDT